MIMFDIKYLPDSTEFSEYELKKIEHLNLEQWITNYKYKARNGSWFLIAKDKDGIWFKFELWHCSCYWPIENGYSWKFTKEQIIGLIKALDTKDYWYSDSITEEEKQSFLEFVIDN